MYHQMQCPFTRYPLLKWHTYCYFRYYKFNLCLKLYGQMALVVINVCYFCKTICGQDMIKIAQPGHAGAVPTPPPGRVLASLYLHMPYRELSTIC